MRILTKEEYYSDIGYSGTDVKFSQAFLNASGKRKEDAIKRGLIQGAEKAFREGRPENIQTYLSEPQDISRVTGIIRDLSQGSDDENVAVIDRAFAKRTEESKKDTLNEVLRKVLENDFSAEKFFIVALLKSGADANYAYGGFPGSMLAKAVYSGQPPSICELLIDNGASVEGALHRAHAKNYSYDDTQILKNYQAKTSGIPAAVDADTRETISQMRQEFNKQVGDLAAKVDLLAEEVRELKSRPDAPEARPPEEKKVSAPSKANADMRNLLRQF